MAMDHATKAALFNALAWIESKKQEEQVDAENVEVGVQCLTYVGRFPDSVASLVLKYPLIMEQISK